MKLTPREKQVLEGLLEEQSDKEIGEELHLSEHTVGAMLRILYIKLGCRTRVGAAVAYMRLNNANVR